MVNKGTACWSFPRDLPCCQIDAPEEYKPRLLPEVLKLTRVEKWTPMEYRYGVFAVSLPL